MDGASTASVTPVRASTNDRTVTKAHWRADVDLGVGGVVVDHRLEELDVGVGRIVGRRPGADHPFDDVAHGVDHLG